MILRLAASLHDAQDLAATTGTGTYFGVDLLLYLALILLFIWRCIAPLQPSSGKRQHLNYCTALYVFLLGLFVTELVLFIRAAAEDFRSPQKTNIFLTMVLVVSPPAILITLVLSWFLTREHLQEVEDGHAAAKHDRALQIIALPPIYGLMAMSALVKLYKQVTHDLGDEQRGIAFARYETCIFVADLYEAWALYQFGTLTFELLDSTFTERQELMAGGGALNMRSRFMRRNRSSGDVVITFTAVSSLAWLGTWLFVVICILQAGWSLWLWTFHDPASDWSKYEAEMKKFSYAGLVASGAAVYNVHTIERTFGHLIDGYYPLLKFLSVKLLVFFAFWQLKVLLVLRGLNILQMTLIQVKILHAALLVFECLGSAVLHVSAWSAKEKWYTLGDHIAWEASSSRSEGSRSTASSVCSEDRPARTKQKALEQLRLGSSGGP